MAATFQHVLRGLEGVSSLGQRHCEAGTQTELTLGEVFEQARAWGAGLLEQGLCRGDRVAIMLTSTQSFLAAVHGCLLYGLVAVPMYPPLSFGRLDAFVEQAATICVESNAAVLLTDRGLHRVLFSLVERTPLRTVLDATRLSKAAVADIPELRPEDLALLQYTSGSTVRPKGVRVTHGALLANARTIMGSLDGSPQDHGVSWLPLYHDMGLIGFGLAPLLTHTPTTFLPTLDFIRRPAIWLETIDAVRGTITFAPNFAYAVATNRVDPSGLDLSSVKMWGCGAEPADTGTLARFEAHFARCGVKEGGVAPCYGLAEATLAVSFTLPGEPRRSEWIDAEAYLHDGVARPTERAEDGLEIVSCGRPMPTVEVEIVDTHGTPLAERQVGEIVVRGPSVADGYEGRGEETAAVFRDGLWTGDRGYLAEGQLYVTGRLKDIVIIRGRNYDPHAIEQRVAEVEGIRPGNVIAFNRGGVDGDELVILAEAREPAPAAEKVVKHVAATIGLEPDDVVLLKPGLLPKTSSGKLQRAKARQQYLSGSLGAEGSRLPSSRASAAGLVRHLGASYKARFTTALRSKEKR